MEKWNKRNDVKKKIIYTYFHHSHAPSTLILYFSTIFLNHKCIYPFLQPFSSFIMLFLLSFIQLPLPSPFIPLSLNTEQFPMSSVTNINHHTLSFSTSPVHSPFPSPVLHPVTRLTQSFLSHVSIKQPLIPWTPRMQLPYFFPSSSSSSFLPLEEEECHALPILPQPCWGKCSLTY